MRRAPRPSGSGITLLAALLASACISNPTQAAPPKPHGTEQATFAGGCFWCMEPPFERRDGVLSAVSGYTGGPEKSPAYKEVAMGRTGHTESVRVTYDPARITYDELLDIFWRSMDPTDGDGQFGDRGPQYRPAIFAHDPTQRRLAEASKAELQKNNPFGGKAIVVPIVDAGLFWEAEDDHQDYYKKNSGHYKAYRRGSGREGFLKKHWGNDQGIKATTGTSPDATPKKAGYHKPSDAEIEAKLTPIQYRVTQHEGTEPPYRNEFWNNKTAGIYVDVVTGEPLFSSTHKFDSGTGWPSFWQPLEAAHIVEKTDRTLFATRTEVRSKHGDSHLGHVFDDGPQPTGLRYCINSAALRFVPEQELTAAGYARYAALFD